MTKTARMSCPGPWHDLVAAEYNRRNTISGGLVHAYFWLKFRLTLREAERIAKWCGQ